MGGYESLPVIVKMVAGQTIWLFLLGALFIPLEHFFAVRRQPTLRSHLVADIGYYYMTAMTGTFVLAIPLSVMTVVAHNVMPQAYLAWAGKLPILLRIVLSFIVGDFGSYWAHRMMHEVPWLWRFHATHHEPERVDWLINSRANPIDLVITRLPGIALMTMAGFGGSAPGSPDAFVATMAVFAGIVWSFFIHANIGWRLGWLEHIVSTPHFHHWHHSRVDHPNRNYAAIFPIYDRLFGTHHMPKGAWPPSYGIAPENQPEVLIAARYEKAPEKAKDSI